MGCWRLVTAGVHWASSTDGKRRRDGSSGAQLRGKKGALTESADYMRGVINLRGKVIPVVDLRLRFGMESIDYTERTCIIVVEIEGLAGTVMIGIVVDSVSEVLNIKGEDIEDTPTFGAKLNTEYILGMAKMEGGVKILLDIDRVLSAADVNLLQKVA